jgi:cell division protein FtsN
MKSIVFAIFIAAVVASCHPTRRMYATPFEDEDEEVVVMVENRVKEEPVQETTPTRDVTREAPIRVQQEKVTMRYGATAKRYHVIVGSFANEYNATRLRDKLNEAGYTSTIMSNQSNMNRVSIAGFDDEFSAREELRRIRHIYPEYQDAWLLVAR